MPCRVPRRGLQKKESLRTTFLQPSFSFVKEVDPYLIFVFESKNVGSLKSHFFCAILVFKGRINNKKSSKTKARTPFGVRLIATVIAIFLN